MRNAGSFFVPFVLVFWASLPLCHARPERRWVVQGSPFLGIHLALHEKWGGTSGRGRPRLQPSSESLICMYAACTDEYIPKNPGVSLPAREDGEKKTRRRREGQEKVKRRRQEGREKTVRKRREAPRNPGARAPDERMPPFPAPSSCWCLHSLTAGLAVDLLDRWTSMSAYVHRGATHPMHALISRQPLRHASSYMATNPTTPIYQPSVSSVFPLLPLLTNSHGQPWCVQTLDPSIRKEYVYIFNRKARPYRQAGR